MLRTTSRRTPETSWQQGSASFTGVGEVVGVGVVGVVGGCEHTALSASAFGIHSATYNSCNSVAGSDRPKEGDSLDRFKDLLLVNCAHVLGSVYL